MGDVLSDDGAVTVRPATWVDAEAVAKIWIDRWRDAHLGHVPDELLAVRTEESFGVRASQRVDDTTVATVNGVVAGFVMVVGDEVEQVYVSKEHRGTSVATILLAEAERLVVSNGHRKAWLAVVAGNPRARRFYERNDWTDEGTFEYAASTASGSVIVPTHRYTKELLGRTSL
ncbi:hypothetical protein Aple_096410 [Acrocarpospora pleiomorpha]|uniref:N-acetyltransferase domain-containing protein n=1 Tax=Acrocarpospora pleiomorpha TaxID=90975 RepID=A0A5M3Y081_9ACTN|nr:hypothetical protein Aple_096410 [Acrocarpospora pleiomorpha]